MSVAMCWCCCCCCTRVEESNKPSSYHHDPPQTGSTGGGRLRFRFRILHSMQRYIHIGTLLISTQLRLRIAQPPYPRVPERDVNILHTSKTCLRTTTVHWHLLPSKKFWYHAAPPPGPESSLLPASASVPAKPPSIETAGTASHPADPVPAQFHPRAAASGRLLQRCTETHHYCGPDCAIRPPASIPPHQRR